MFVATLICCIIVIVILLALLIGLIVAAVIIHKKRDLWFQHESKFCYMITCPCDGSSGPCHGYAKRAGDISGSWHCSNAPNTLVDDEGKPL